MARILISRLISRLGRVAVGIVAVCAISAIYLTAHLVAQLPAFGGALMPADAITEMLLRLVVQFFQSSLIQDLPYLAGFAVVSEAFSVRPLWLHMVFFVGGAVARLPAAAMPGSDTSGYFAAAAIGAGMAAGTAYWLIAGRTAGLRPDASA